MQKIILQLEELVCPSCLKKIEAAVGRIEGVLQFKVLFNASKVKAEIDPSKTSAEEISSAIESIGFNVLSQKIK